MALSNHDIPPPRMLVVGMTMQSSRDVLGEARDLPARPRRTVSVRAGLTFSHIYPKPRANDLGRPPGQKACPNCEARRAIRTGAGKQVYYILSF